MSHEQVCILFLFLALGDRTQYYSPNFAHHLGEGLTLFQCLLLVRCNVLRNHHEQAGCLSPHGSAGRLLLPYMGASLDGTISGRFARSFKICWRPS